MSRSIEGEIVERDALATCEGRRRDRSIDSPALGAIARSPSKSLDGSLERVDDRPASSPCARPFSRI